MNAQDIHNAADTLERMHKQYDGMARTAAVLRDLAVMVNRIESAEARLAEVGKARDAAEAALASALAQHNADEHKVAPMDIDLTYSDIVAGTGFTIQAFVRRGRAYGLYNLNFGWV